MLAATQSLELLMKRIVWTFGLISGAVLAAMLLITSAFTDEIGFDRGAIIGYTTMLAASLLTYFGVRSYRDSVLGGAIRFGKAFQAALLIVLVSSVCYVVAWEFVYRRISPDFAQVYSAQVLEKAKTAGATPEQLAAQAKSMAEFQARYKNMFFRAAMTLVEPLPVGLLMALVSAGVLSRRRKVDA